MRPSLAPPPEAQEIGSSEFLDPYWPMRVNLNSLAPVSIFGNETCRVAKQAKSASTKKSSTKPPAKKAPAKGAVVKKPAAKTPATRASSATAAASPSPPAAKPAVAAQGSGHIYIGVGGWTFAPWRGVFYPDKLPQAKELEYAGSKLTSIEINGTYYGSQKPESFRKWAREVPDGFVFSVKGSRFTTNRRVLAEAGDSIKHFYNTGVLELGDRLGPVLWQFAPTKKFEEVDFGKFLELLPREMDGRKLRHVVEVRHDSFRTPAFIALLRQFEIPVVFAEHFTYPGIADVVGDFVYARLQKGNDDIATCYPPQQLDQWAARLQLWASGGEPDDLPRVDAARAPNKPRDVFAYVIHEGKVRAPAGAMELIERLR
jgi:uncharacterized protein YecE (DUF72 family)